MQPLTKDYSLQLNEFYSDQNRENEEGANYMKVIEYKKYGPPDVLQLK